MKSSITLTKVKSPETGEMSIHVQVSGTKEDALELLAYGSRSVRECLGISLMDYLEALVDARDQPNLYRTVIDTSLLSGLDGNEDS